jgi:hypothetical protein
MATDLNLIITNLLAFYDFTNKTIVSVGAGGGQRIFPFPCRMRWR